MPKQMAPLIIERMACDDVEEIARIEEVVFPTPWSSACFYRILKEASTCSLLIRGDDGAVMGYIVAWFIADELYVGNIAVAPSRRRRGVGAALLNAMIDEARRRSCRAAFLELRESNYPAMRLYQKFAFKPVAVKRNYYWSPPENAIVMRRDLEASPTFSKNGPGLHTPGIESRVNNSGQRG